MPAARLLLLPQAQGGCASQFNPSYLWSESPAFVSAQADARRFFTDTVDYDRLPAASTARWFRWAKHCPGAPPMPHCPAGCAEVSECSNCSTKPNFAQPGRHWIHSAAADACYWLVPTF